jgi:hypothetical protein
VVWSGSIRSGCGTTPQRAKTWFSHLHLISEKRMSAHLVEFVVMLSCLAAFTDELSHSVCCSRFTNKVEKLFLCLWWKTHHYRRLKDKPFWKFVVLSFAARRLMTDHCSQNHDSKCHRNQRYTLASSLVCLTYTHVIWIFSCVCVCFSKYPFFSFSWLYFRGTHKNTHGRPLSAVNPTL